jgi:hypothetical protein
MACMQIVPLIAFRTCVSKQCLCRSERYTLQKPLTKCGLHAAMRRSRKSIGGRRSERADERAAACARRAGAVRARRIGPGRYGELWLRTPWGLPHDLMMSVMEILRQLTPQKLCSPDTSIHLAEQHLSPALQRRRARIFWLVFDKKKSGYTNERKTAKRAIATGVFSSAQCCVPVSATEKASQPIPPQAPPEPQVGA